MPLNANELIFNQSILALVFTGLEEDSGETGEQHKFANREAVP
jgi:hypothetical protein